MKRLFKGLMALLALVFVFALSSCGKYKEEAGVYHLVEASGMVSLNQFEYYTIELEADGDCIIRSKGAGTGQSYEAKATFEIDGEKIMVYSKANGTTVTEEYDYIDGKIIMDISMSGYKVYCVFERNTEE